MLIYQETVLEMGNVAKALSMAELEDWHLVSLLPLPPMRKQGDIVKLDGQSSGEKGVFFMLLLCHETTAEEDAAALKQAEAMANHIATPADDPTSIPPSTE